MKVSRSYSAKTSKPIIITRENIQRLESLLSELNKADQNAGVKLHEWDVICDDGSRIRDTSINDIFAHIENCGKLITSMSTSNSIDKP